MACTARALILFGFVIGTAACGGDTAALDPVARAATKSAHAGSYRCDIVSTFRFAGQTISGRGRCAGDGESAVQHITTPPQPGLAMPKSTLTLIVDGRGGRLDVYTNVPVPELEGGKKWMKIDILRSLRKHGLERSDLPAAGMQNPGDFVAALRAANGDVMLGKETIDGVKTTHYRTEVDSEKAVAAAAPEKREALRRFLGGERRTTDVDVWIDGQGLIRRLRQKTQTPADTITITFHDWGAPFTLHVPPASKTVDVTNRDDSP